MTHKRIYSKTKHSSRKRNTITKESTSSFWFLILYQIVIILDLIGNTTAQTTVFILRNCTRGILSFFTNINLFYYFIWHDLAQGVMRMLLLGECGIQIVLKTITSTLKLKTLFKKMTRMSIAFASRIIRIPQQSVAFLLTLHAYIHRKKTALLFFGSYKLLALRKALRFSFISQSKKSRSKRKGREKNNLRLVFSRTFKWSYAIPAFVLVAIMGIHLFLQTIPHPRTLDDFMLPASTQIYDKNNILLYSSYAGSYRVPIKISEVPQILVDATVTAEDKRFFSHSGFDLLAIGRSFVYNSTHDSVQGGSTITQQLAKNVFLTTERSLLRKLEELIISYRIERTFTKNQILELYFNSVSYGGDTIGIEAASERYFGKKAKELSEKESLYLATLTSAPSVYSTRENQTILANKRMSRLLDNLVKENKITLQKRAAILKMNLTFAPRIIYKKAPHAVDYVLKQLENKYGSELMNKTGFIVRTTIDLKLQNYIQEQVREFISSSEYNNITNAGVILTNPRNGNIEAMVGSADYYGDKGGQYNTVTASRQLGSSVKLITYARALEDRMTPETPILDAPISFRDFPGYSPRNYDNKFRGVVSLKAAFANSYNIPALKLAYQVGLDRVATLGYKMGIPEWNFPQGTALPLSMAIGGVELSLEHLTRAYSIIANDGKNVELHAIESISDYKGRSIYSHKPAPGSQIVSSDTSRKIFDILSDNNARLAAFGRSSQLEFANTQVAIKTGTSNDNKDNVAMAFTPDFVIGVWVGNNDSSSMWNIASGYVGATNIMHSIAQRVIDTIAGKQDSKYAIGKN